MLSCKLRNKMCFLASGSGTHPHRVVLGLFILVSEVGFSLVAGQMFLLCRGQVMCRVAALGVFWPVNVFGHFLSRAGSTRFEEAQGAWSE